MGIRIFTVDEAPVPRRSLLELTCDEHADLFPPRPQRFDEDGYIAPHSAAMSAAGWIERRDARRGRAWIGRCCSGKKAAAP